MLIARLKIATFRVNKGTIIYFLWKRRVLNSKLNGVYRYWLKEITLGEIDSEIKESYCGINVLHGYSADGSRKCGLTPPKFAQRNN